jgi:hypothetical protein
MSPLTLERLEARETPAVASSAGVAYVLDDDTGAVVWKRPLDPDFAGPLFVAELDGDILIGAGQGGGPRVVRFDWATQTEKWSVFVGDPASRTGVSVAAFAGYKTTLDIRPDQGSPGDPAAVRLEASRLPAPIGAWLAPHVTVDVYAEGRLGGLYRPSLDTIFIHQDAAKFTLHELGHAVEDHIPADWYARWLDVWADIDWDTFPTGSGSVDYFRYHEYEAFAESFSLWVGAGGASLSPAVRGYFDSLSLALGWRG